MLLILTLFPAIKPTCEVCTLENTVHISVLLYNMFVHNGVTLQDLSVVYGGCEWLAWTSDAGGRPRPRPPGLHPLRVAVDAESRPLQLWNASSRSNTLFLDIIALLSFLKL